jgi:glycerol kinase
VSAAALDLGSTRIKLALLGDDGRLAGPEALDAPPIRGADEVREFDADDYRRRAESLLALVPGDARLGIASQRSSFVLWERASGRPIRPAISWQDRRAARWCAERPELATRIPSATGLLLSPHYVGPKLAALFEEDRALAGRLERREVLVGTLETYLAWHWSRGAVHETDLTMGARTLLVDPRRREWSSELCGAFGVSIGALPTISKTAGRETQLASGVRLVASLSDQAAGLLAMLPSDSQAVLVNLGTGSFVLRPTGESFAPVRGLLAGPVLADSRRTLFALEGTINAGGATVARFGDTTSELAARDEHPDAFCLPDENGIGAPHWLATRGFELSPAARALDQAAQRAVVLEGLAFRVRELVEALFAGARPRRVLVSGGLARDPRVAQLLAATLAQPIELADDVESTLLAAVLLAAGRDPFANPTTTTVEPDPAHAWLAAKYARWRAWVDATLRR